MSMQDTDGAVHSAASSSVRVDDSTVSEGDPILGRARLREGFEPIEVAMANYGYGYLDLSGPCVMIEYPLEFFLQNKHGLSLANVARARKYPFPGGLDVERFTVFVLEPTESSAAYSAKFYVDVRQGELVLVEERYRDGVLYEVDIHRHGDRLSTFLPSAVVDWLVPIPRHCPDLRMRLSANSGIPE